MKRVVRQIVYEGTDAAIDMVLEKSLPIGEKIFGTVKVTISIISEDMVVSSAKKCVTCGEREPKPGRVLCGQCRGDILYPYRG